MNAKHRQKLQKHKDSLDKHLKPVPKGQTRRMWYPQEIHDEITLMRQTWEELKVAKEKGEDITEATAELKKQLERVPAIRSHPRGCHIPGDP